MKVLYKSFKTVDEATEYATTRHETLINICHDGTNWVVFWKAKLI